MATPQDIVSKYSESILATHTFSTKDNPTLYLEHYFNLPMIEEFGIPIIGNMGSCGIRKYFDLKESVVPGLIRMFYDSIAITSNQFQGTVLGVKIDIHPESIAEAIGCECISNKYEKQWMRNVGGISTVHQALVKEGEEATETIVYNKMNELAKVYQQILNKSILHRHGGKDGITEVHKFCLYHMVSGEPFDLPSLLYTHWRGTLNDRAKCVYHTMLLNKILRVKGVYDRFGNLSEEEVTAINKQGDNKLLQPINFGRGNLGKMGLSIIASTRVKAETKEEQPTQRVRTRKTTAPSVQKKTQRKLVLNESESDDDMPIATTFKRKEMPSVSKKERPKKKGKIGKPAKTSFPSEIQTELPVNPSPPSADVHNLTSVSKPTSPTFSSTNISSSVCSKPIIKTKPWTPPQGTPQYIDRDRPASTYFVPKIKFHTPFTKLLPIPIHLYKTPTMSELAIAASIRFCSEIPNQMYIPPTLYTNSNTQILVAPDRICPRLPPLNLQKLKEVVSVHEPDHYPPNFNFTSYIPQNLPATSDLTEDEAERCYRKFMNECSRNACSSGLTKEEKNATTTLKGSSWTSDADLYHFSDFSVAFVRSSKVDEWKQVINNQPSSSHPLVLDESLSAAQPPPDPVSLSESDLQFATMDKLQEFKTEISQKMDNRIAQLMQFLSSRLPPRDPPQ